MSISAVRIPASTTAKNAVIFLHGLGDSGDGWSWFPQVISQSGILKAHESTNYVFPNAPSIPISVNGGMKMPGWFDIYEFNNPNAKQDVTGFLKSCDVVKALIREQHEIHQIPMDRIVIGGFSQGAAVSMATLALLEEKIGGLVALSGFCPITETLGGKIHNVNFDTPVFQGHGDLDPIIHLKFGRQTADFYKDAGFSKWDFREYPGVPHSADNRELLDVVNFLTKVFD